MSGGPFDRVGQIAWLMANGGACACVITRVLGMVLTGWASERATAGFTRAYAPFVSAVEASLADPCRAPGRYFSLPTVAASCPLHVP